ncbi:MAG: hypothetical protein HY553_03785 [Elusimicrobia bacterium]|nr:hypothetical protein [Elusimicrobiota bacterium]
MAPLDLSDSRIRLALLVALLLLGAGIGLEGARLLRAKDAAPGASGPPRPSELARPSALSIAELEALLASPEGRVLAGRLFDALERDVRLRERWELLRRERPGPSRAALWAAMRRDPIFEALLADLERESPREDATAGEAAPEEPGRLSARIPMAGAPTVTRRSAGGEPLSAAGSAPVRPRPGAAPSRALRPATAAPGRIGLSAPAAGGRASAYTTRPATSGDGAHAATPLAGVRDAESTRMARLLEVYPWLGRLTEEQRRGVQPGIDSSGLWGSCFARTLYAECRRACEAAGPSCVAVEGWQACLDANDGDAARCRTLCARQPPCVAPGSGPTPAPPPDDRCGPRGCPNGYCDIQGGTVCCYDNGGSRIFGAAASCAGTDGTDRTGDTMGGACVMTQAQFDAIIAGTWSPTSSQARQGELPLCR